MTTVGLNYESNAIIELMDVAEADRSDEWLRDALQQAVMLELATLPPYLCGLWSITEDSADVALMIKEVVFNEMTHLGLACNMLTTIGGTPVLASTAVVPPYPCPLPGGVRPTDLTVSLSGLTPASVEMYSEIEKPVHPLAVAAEATTFPSIGAFYDAIHEAFRQPGVPINGTRQLTVDLGHGPGNRLFPLTTLPEVEQAIQLIKEQGEGTSHSPDDPTEGDDGQLAHYYTFRQIFRGRKLVQIQEDPPAFDFAGDPIPFPGALQMAVVPRGGWAADPSTAPVDPEVKRLLDQFNATFSELLRSLECAWREDDPKKASDHLNDAVGSMFGLQGPAVDLMGKPLPGDPAKSYGPEFRYVP
ncbi:ferritin-like protein [Kitasatospora sp. NPDC047058]|uniref:ferritin-like domain-containing protein n=1 Tax=Kitasatospora sp. NPDC047058 TaxID=3155620 RepID=UPI0033F34043